MLQNKHEREEPLTFPDHRKSPSVFEKSPDSTKTYEREKQYTFPDHRKSPTVFESSRDSTKHMKWRNQLPFQISGNHHRYLKGLVILKNKHEKEEPLTFPNHRKSPSVFESSRNSTKHMKWRNQLPFQITENHLRYLKGLDILQNKHEREEPFTFSFHRK
ncbi:unnamed protein product [Mytilus edulis]|uniref:Uncharacterized protein n=1 Tax=Mytilus edulis TaxID=6550 RepID=A0A8S3S1K6_MYTED|nr:unnamed protein product [Mytilus edulis]